MNKELFSRSDLKAGFIYCTNTVVGEYQPDQEGRLWFKNPCGWVAEVNPRQGTLFYIDRQTEV